jgi:hypothetical protein
MAIPARGLRNLRALSGNVDQVVVPHQAYMQITCLEMERTRRGNERRSSSRHIAEIDQRLHEIDTEKEKLLAALAEPRSARPPVDGPPRRPRGGFKLRY